MRAAYVDTSCMLSIAFEEPGWRRTAEELRQCEEIFSSNLLEAELFAAVRRENSDVPRVESLRRLVWVWPDEPLTDYFRVVLSHGYLRGADLWHLASALVLRDRIGEVSFMSLDKRQAEVASRLGLRGLDWI